MRHRAPLVSSVLGVVLFAPGVHAQGYRARIDVQAQGASFRGVTLDSVLTANTVRGAGGGPATPDGFAVNCPTPTGYCYFYRPGPPEHGGPVTAAADVSLWGLGIPGLSARINARAATDLGGLDAWAGNQPAVQLLEGYAEYANGPIRARAGRVQSLNRLGAIGFDGASVTARSSRFGIEATAFGGLGLARAIAVPINSPVLNPLDQYQPSERQIVAGGFLSWSAQYAQAKVSYQREVDRRSQYFISERGGLEVSLAPPVRGLSASGMADYDLALHSLGSADGQVRYRDGPFAVSLGGRRYRPKFDLWTIWGAFSPIGYDAGNATLQVTPIRHVTVSATGEVYQYGPAGAETPLVEVQQNGWRWSVQAAASPRSDFDISAGYRRELGPGAAAVGWEGSATYHPGRRFSITGTASDFGRPLEFRFDDAQVWLVGLHGELRLGENWSLGGGFTHEGETRARPDAASFDWNQTRVDFRLSWVFGSSADQDRLPPAVPTERAR